MFPKQSSFWTPSFDASKPTFKCLSKSHCNNAHFVIPKIFLFVKTPRPSTQRGPCSLVMDSERLYYKLYKYIYIYYIYMFFWRHLAYEHEMQHIIYSYSCITSKNVQCRLLNFTRSVFLDFFGFRVLSEVRALLCCSTCSKVWIVKDKSWVCRKISETNIRPAAANLSARASTFKLKIYPSLFKPLSTCCNTTKL